MCSRFALTSASKTIKTLCGYTTPAQFPPREKIAPTDPIIIVREQTKERREAVLVRWGFIPHWVKDPDDFPLIINARAETLLEKPSFRTSLAHKRCLIPADAFYEWSGPKGRRQMHTIKTPTNTPFAFAGLWDHWLGADGSEFESAVIITVAANQDIAPLHDRMPAIINQQNFDAWLDVRNVRAKDALKLLTPAPNGFFKKQSTAQNEGKHPPKKTSPEQGELF